MADKMLIDAAHPEETRVVVLRGNRVEEFDFESANRKQLRGNIYLAKVTRVEPSLQAAFVDYGGNRHGFLAFSEIHPDYYQIPVADRQALIDEEERAQRAADIEADHRAGRRAERERQGPGERQGERQLRRPRESVRSDPLPPPESLGDGEAMAAGGELMARSAGEEAPTGHDYSQSDEGGAPHDITAEAHAGEPAIPQQATIGPGEGPSMELVEIESSAARESMPTSEANEQAGPEASEPGEHAEHMLHATE